METKEINKPVPNPTVVLREEFDDWAVLFNPDTADAIGTNPVGVAVWKNMDGKRNIDEIVSEITNSFEECPATVSQEISDFINKLTEKGFVGAEINNN